MKLFLSNRHRNEGTRILSGRGTGKSILNAQIAMQDWYENNLATAVWDTGHTIDNILLSIAEMPDATIRKALWKRVRYVNMGGMDGRVIPWPIFHRFTNEPKNEPDADVYERFIAAIQRVNPEL